jgi:hypothetical protein
MDSIGLIIIFDNTWTKLIKYSRTWMLSPNYSSIALAISARQNNAVLKVS